MESEAGSDLAPRENAIVYVIDDDDSLRFALTTLLRSAGFSVFAFERTESFVELPKADVPSCLLLDVRLRGESGLAFQRELRKQKVQMPVIFLTAHGDIDMSVQAIKEGAADFLVKPVKDQRVIDAVVAALKDDASSRALRHTQNELRVRYESLTPRERDVILQVAAGLMNKQIAAEMSLSEITIKFHRSSAMRKMEAASITSLIRMLEALGVLSELRIA
ncbi:Nodulation protein W [Pararobbsia alpina]|uniref:response regulator transcription factor n=1 Tax=Pararobbsia alpina TaxID=621374 RepID=UPI0039A67AF5